MGKVTRGHRGIAPRIFLSARLTAKLEARLAEAVAHPKRLQLTSEAHDLLYQLQSWIAFLKHPPRDAKLAFLNDLVEVQGSSMDFAGGPDQPFSYKVPRFIAIVTKHHQVTLNKTETIERVAKEIGASTRTVRDLLDEFHCDIRTVRPPRRKV